jgi:hypothetical protein
MSSPSSFSPDEICSFISFGLQIVMLSDKSPVNFFQ